MAENISYEDLRSMTLSQLESRMKSIEIAQAKLDLTDDAKTSLSHAQALTKSVIDNKKVIATLLQCSSENDNFQNDKYLSNLFFKMGRQELIDAYDHYASKQRSLFHEYIDEVLSFKDLKDYDESEQTDDCNRSDLDSTLDYHCLPSLTAAFDGIENVLLHPRFGHGDCSFKWMVEEHKRLWRDE